MTWHSAVSRVMDVARIGNVVFVSVTSATASSIVMALRTGATLAQITPAQAGPVSLTY